MNVTFTYVCIPFQKLVGGHLGVKISSGSGIISWHIYPFSSPDAIRKVEGNNAFPFLSSEQSMSGGLLYYPTSFCAFTRWESNICVCLIKKPVRSNFKAPAPFLFVKTGPSSNYQGSASGEPWTLNLAKEDLTQWPTVFLCWCFISRDRSQWEVTGC